eukprot:2488277-Lingulodinium_polyedra.AAC.1
MIPDDFGPLNELLQEQSACETGLVCSADATRPGNDDLEERANTPARKRPRTETPQRPKTVRQKLRRRTQVIDRLHKAKALVQDVSDKKVQELSDLVEGVLVFRAGNRGADAGKAARGAPLTIRTLLRVALSSFRVSDSVVQEMTGGCVSPSSRRRGVKIVAAMLHVLVRHRALRALTSAMPWALRVWADLQPPTLGCHSVGLLSGSKSSVENQQCIRHLEDPRTTAPRVVCLCWKWDATPT